MNKSLINKEIQKIELFILDYIKKNICQKIQDYCQFFVSKILMERIAEKEFIFLEKLEIKIREQLKMNTPLHYSTIYNGILSGVRNDLCIQFYGYKQYFEWKKDKIFNDFKCVYLTYASFEKEGISYDMCKRILNNLIINKILMKKKYIGCTKYTLNNLNLNKFKDDIIPLDCFIDYGPNGFEENKNYKWIIDEFSKEEIKKIFDNEKEKLFSFI